MRGTKSKGDRIGHLLTLLLIIALGVSAQEPAKRESEAEAMARADELVHRARVAIGGEEAIKQIQTLSTTGKYRRYIKYFSVQSPKKVVEKQKTIEGSLEFDFIFPDKFRQRVKSETMRGIGYSYAEVISGNDAWRDPPLRPISSNRDRRVVDVGDVQRTELMSAQEARQQVTLFLLGWLLQTPSAFPLELQDAKAFQTALGLADVIWANGSGGFSLFLLLDPKSHLPLGLAVPFLETRQPVIIVEAIGYFDRRFMQETFARARAERQARVASPAKREFQLRFSDHRPVAGILLPHKITTTIDGEVYEEMVFEEFEINHPINPKKFKPPKQKE